VPHDLDYGRKKVNKAADMEIIYVFWGPLSRFKDFQPSAQYEIKLEALTDRKTK
jgi:hypothetical protein